jgi:hypothetical protein
MLKRFRALRIARRQDSEQHEDQNDEAHARYISR